jgi:Zn-dependent protease with chaperone function
MRCLAVLILLLAHGAVQARLVSIVEPSRGLAFTQAAVIEHAQANQRALLDDARSQGRLGCVAYCTQLAEVWRRLLPVVRFQQTGGAPALRLVVVTNPDIQALSFPDGTVVISEVFIRRMQLAAPQLAFVLAHEAAHVLLQHERQTLTSMLALIPSRAQRTPQDVYTEMEFNYFAMADAMSVVFHHVELEADELGMQLAALAGYAPQAQLVFLERSLKRGSRQSMVSTHPDMAQRLRRLGALLPLARRLLAVGRQ